MVVRVLTEPELSIVKHLAYKIWPVAYQSILTKEQMDYMLNWMSVYPNPVMKELHFTIVEELPKTVSIFDLGGNYIEKPIINGKVYVSDLAPGTYYIRILIDGKVQQEKFIKQ